MECRRWKSKEVKGNGRCWWGRWLLPESWLHWPRDTNMNQFMSIEYLLSVSPSLCFYFVLEENKCLSLYSASLFSFSTIVNIHGLYFFCFLKYGRLLCYIVLPWNPNTVNVWMKWKQWKNAFMSLYDISQWNDIAELGTIQNSASICT